MSELKPEILLQIFELLRKPLPKPHSEFPVDRSEIRQPDLAACLRVSRQWYSLSAPVLYRQVVGDSLPLLLVGVNHKPISGLSSKLDLLGRTQRLFLEYSHKVDNPDLTYQDLMEYSMFEVIDGGETERLLRRDLQGVREAEDIAEAWGTIVKNGRLRRIFTNLRTLSIGAYPGQQEEIWRHIGMRFNEWSQAVFGAQRIMLAFLTETKSLRHFCQNGSNRPTIATHSSYPQTTLLPASIGVQSRWYIHTDPAVPGYNAQITSMWLRNNVNDVLNNRLNFSADRWYCPTVPSWDVKGETYLRLTTPGSKTGTTGQKKTWRTKTDDKEKEIARVIRTKKSSLPSWIEVNDKWTVKQLFDAPDCEACGWTYQT